MRKIGIVGGNEIELERELLKFSDGEVEFLNENALKNETKLDALMAQNAKPVLEKAIDMLNEGAYLIINSDKKEMLPFIAKKKGSFRLITYGFNSRACVTASGTMDGVLQTCVQRGFVSFDGRMAEPQEFGFPYETEADAALGLAALYILCSKRAVC